MSGVGGNFIIINDTHNIKALYIHNIKALALVLLYISYLSLQFRVKSCDLFGITAKIEIVLLEKANLFTLANGFGFLS